jgi:hypothetical protein
VVEGVLAHVQAQEPFEEDVVLEPLAELTLAPNRVDRHQQAALEQMLGWIEGRPAATYMASKVGAKLFRAWSTIGRTRRIGCRSWISSSDVTALSRDSWRTVEPRVLEASKT